MTSLHDPLLHRIEEFCIDEGGAAVTYADRLAHENGWSKAFTQRVIGEYKRYVYLTQVAGHMAVPSEEVDQAWHLHLTYTRSYWERLCGEVLGRPLHHNPSRGGEQERRKFIELYRQTLASYEAVFGERPPADIWPDPEIRFGCNWRRVDAGRYWLVRKPRLRLGQATPLLGMLPLGAALTPDIFPFTLHRAEFLGFYIPAYLVAFAVALALRWHLRRPGPDCEARAGELNPVQAAYLAGGESMAVNAAVAALAARGALAIGADGQLHSSGPLAGDESRLERKIHGRLERQSAANIKELRDAVAHETKPVREALTEQGLLVGDDDALLARLAPLALSLAVPALGLLRLANGLSAGRPVGFLVVVLVLSMVTSVAVFLRRPLRSRCGDAALNQLRVEYDRLQRDIRAGSTSDLALGVALFGVGALAGSALEPLRKTLSPHASSPWGGGGCGGWSSCTSVGSGCGGGGCGGGCGGGGCGGCGS